MSKKNNKNAKQNNKEEIVDYYKLNTDAVNRLVNASEQNATAEVGSEPKHDPYKSGFLSRVPDWLKALFIKFWFNGAVCFFFIWGLGIYIKNLWDMILVAGVALGIVTDVMVNNLFRFMNSDEREYDKWMLLPMKKFWTFFANIIYAMAVMIAVMFTYEGINILINSAQGGASDQVYLGVEPILFGVFYLLYDLAFIWLKNLVVMLVKRAKTKSAQTKENQSDILD
ncbi:MAG: hypothetical protein NC350_00385 [Corallococcus sp.]|nr:hypothetical protein [Corallococcus sp.]